MDCNCAKLKGGRGGERRKAVAKRQVTVVVLELYYEIHENKTKIECNHIFILKIVKRIEKLIKGKITIDKNSPFPE